MKLLELFTSYNTEVNRDWISVTYNDSSNWVNPALNIISKKCSHKPNNIGDDIKKVILCIGLHYFIGECSAIYNQEKLHQCQWKHNIDKPLFLLFCQAEFFSLIKQKYSTPAVQENIQK